VEARIEPPCGSLEGVAGKVDEAAAGAPPAGGSRRGVEESRTAVQLGIPKEILAVTGRDQEQQCGVHWSLRLSGHRERIERGVTACWWLIGYVSYISYLRVTCQVV